MTPEEENTASGEETAPETQTETTEAPTLNRAQRRAQAKGNKAGTGGFNSGPQHGHNSRGAGGRNANAPTKSIIPRSGHK